MNLLNLNLHPAPPFLSEGLRAFRKSMYRISMKNLPDLNAIYRYLADKETGWKPKALTALALLYVLWPADLVPDIPVLGWLDDAGILFLAGWYLSRKAKKFKAYDKKK